MRARGEVEAFLAAEGWKLLAAVPSPIAGGDGNNEIVLVLTRQ